MFSVGGQPTPDEKLALSVKSLDDEERRESTLGILWSRIEALPPEQQGSLRLPVGLLHPNKTLDGHEAEYYVLWARQRGLSERQIMDAFGCG